VDCEGECDIYSCEKCRKFYDTPIFDESSNVLTVEKHPWYEKMGLEQPGLWPRVSEQWIPQVWQEYNAWFKVRQEYSVTDWGLHGSRNWVGNENRKHPVMMLLMEAYEFVNLPEPVSVMSGPLGKVQLPMLKDVWALKAKSSCRASIRRGRDDSGQGCRIKRSRDLSVPSAAHHLFFSSNRSSDSCDPQLRFHQVF